MNDRQVASQVGVRTSASVVRAPGRKRAAHGRRRARGRHPAASPLVGVAGALAFTASSGAAEAHTGLGAVGGFAAGFVHPLTGLDHLLAMVAVGVWGAILGRPLIVALPVIFPLMMVLGGLLGMFGAPFPPVELGVALSVLGLGAAIAAAWRAPVWAACGLVAAFALCHGYAHGRELPASADPVGYSAGFVLATGLLHLAGVAVGLLSERPAGARPVRAGGAAIALCGLAFLVQALR